jgi:hypothetical protein
MLGKLHQGFPMTRLGALLSTFDTWVAGETSTWMDAIRSCTQAEATIESFELHVVHACGLHLRFADRLGRRR